MSAPAFVNAMAVPRREAYAGQGKSAHKADRSPSDSSPFLLSFSAYPVVPSIATFSRDDKKLRSH